ncbi:hypothetical protein DPMN_178558 [Dreissena polymorpha]|uniref:Uncharacterized protein n=1 Tax=Dreissena polymorpha TaxID=45954 RepID=A0A9D4ECD0_DREPO|nr:hypothetical protein DPMN_178558 [Dreissena polymorpha]
MVRNLVFHSLFADDGKETFQTMEKRRSLILPLANRQFHQMPCKKKKVVQRVHSSPAQKSAKAVSNKYKLKGKRMSARKTMAVRRALNSECNERRSKTGEKENAFH